MQRMPTREPPSRGQDDSPMLRLARRIRQEQGAEQVKAFLAAMTPFSAPNEIKRIGENFGIPFESIENERMKREPVRQNAPNAGAVRPANQMDQLDRINRLRTLMQLAGMMKNGGDPMALINLLKNG